AAFNPQSATRNLQSLDSRIPARINRGFAAFDRLFLLLAVADDEVFALVVGDAVVRDRVEQPDVGADDGVGADPGRAAEDRGVRVDSDAFADVGVAFDALDRAAVDVDLEGFRAECDAQVDLHVRADACAFTDHVAGTVVDEEVCPDLRARV